MARNQTVQPMSARKSVHYRVLLLSLLGALIGSGIAAAQDGTLRRVRVPILMYHYVGPLPQDADPLRTGLTVRTDEFRDQLTWLRREGYSSISFDQLFAALDEGAPLPDKPVILSFDDGYRDHFTVALPLLLEAGFAGTFFVISERVDAQDPNHLDREQVAAMAAEGMTMESHSRSHRDLAGRDRDTLVFELLGSRETLEAYTGRAPVTVAWPFGSHDALARQVAREAGYRMAVSTRAGVLHSNTGLFDLARIRINRNLTPRGLEALISGELYGE